MTVNRKKFSSGHLLTDLQKLVMQSCTVEEIFYHFCAAVKMFGSKSTLKQEFTVFGVFESAFVWKLNKCINVSGKKGFFKGSVASLLNGKLALIVVLACSTKSVDGTCNPHCWMKYALWDTFGLSCPRWDKSFANVLSWTCRKIADANRLPLMK